MEGRAFFSNVEFSFKRGFKSLAARAKPRPPRISAVPPSLSPKHRHLPCISQETPCFLSHDPFSCCFHDLCSSRPGRGPGPGSGGEDPPPSPSEKLV